MVIHAGIDGYSRLAVCCCSTNNLASTMLALFREAVNSLVYHHEYVVIGDAKTLILAGTCCLILFVVWEGPA